MKKAEIKVGGHYTARISGRYVTVRVDAIRIGSGWQRDCTLYDVTNLMTGRKTTFRSAAKFRGEAKPTQAVKKAYIEEAGIQVVDSDAARAAFDAAVARNAEEAPPDEDENTSEEGEESSDFISSADDEECENKGQYKETKGVIGLASQIASQTVERVTNLTPEQEDILATAREIEARSGGPRVVVIGAGAGTGKTFTLKQLEQVLRGAGQYTAFNASLVNESKAKFTRAACNTTHSLAFRAVGRRFSHRLDGPRVKSYQLAGMLGLEDYYVELPEAIAPLEDGKPQVRRLKAAFLAGQVIGAVRKFCQSSDREITRRHFVRIDGIDESGSRANSDKVLDYLVPVARRAWVDLSSETGVLPFNHDCYVKIWALGEGPDRPVIAADYILLDEAQDTAEVMLGVLSQQEHALLVLVGDDNQQIYCQPEGTKVLKTERVSRSGYELTEVPIETIKVGDTVATYAQNYRLGRITKKGCRVSSITTRTVNEDLITVRVAGHQTRYTKNHHCVIMLGGMLVGKWVVYMQRSGKNYRVGCCNGVYESQMNQIGPLVRAKQEDADAVWILETFDTKEDALTHERCLLVDFAGRCFQSSGGDEWWEFQLSNEQEAAELLASYDKDICEPLLHLGEEWVDKSRTPVVTAARNLLNGMLMLPFSNVPYSEEDRGHTVLKSHWAPIEVATVGYRGQVVSISVDGDHTYVADGVVTHNSWRGAVNAMAAFPGAPRRLLSQSFRFGQAVADVANSVLAGLQTPTDLIMRGLESIPSRVCEVAEPRCYIYRTNAGCLGRLMEAHRDGKRGYLVGGRDYVSGLVAFCRAALDLQARRGTSHPELGCFETWSEVQDYSKEDEGADLRLMVKMVDEFGADGIIQVLNGMPQESEADLVVSTAHRSKGREWPSVQLGPDFPLPNRMDDSDRRLIYVAATRAQEELDVSQCPTFMGGWDKRGGGEDGEGVAEWVPGIPVVYTAPMPTAGQLAEYRAAKRADAVAQNAPANATRPDPNVGREDAPTAAVGVANGRGGEFTWANMDGQWLVRGPADTPLGDRVTVVKKSGQKSEETLRGVHRKMSDLWFYTVR